MFVTSQQAQIDQLAAVIAAVLNTSVPAHCSVKLATGPFAPTPTSDPTTFTEATFDGYAAKTVAAWSASYILPGNVAECIPSAVLTWIPTGTTTPNTITGYWIMLGNGSYGGGEALPTPVVLNSPATSLSLVPVWQIARGQWNGNVLS